MIYTASTLSLALLEIIANSGNRELPADYVYSLVDIQDNLIERIDFRALPTDWYEFPAPPALQTFGNIWVAEQRSMALLVPSAVARIEYNVLLNPAHPSFADGLKTTNPDPLPVDRRLPIARPTRKKNR